MDEVKKICCVIPSLGAGGMERVMAELLEEFSKDASVKLHLILYGIKRDIFYPLPNNISIHKPTFEFNNTYRFWFTLRTIWYLRTRIKQIKPNCVLSFGELWNNLVLLATYGLKFPVFVSDRCQPDKSLGKLHDWLRIKLYPKASGVIAQTQQAKFIYQKSYKHPNIKVIGNPIREIKSDNISHKENIVISVGRLINTKHHDELIKLFAAINQPNWKLVIVGDDAIKQNNKVRLQQLIKDLNATDKIILTGKRNDVEQFYLKSKIFAFTSSSEGFPNVIGEAQSAGLAVVAFDCVAGPSEMVHEGENGFLIPLFDYKTFRNKLEFLMENEVLRREMGKNAAVSIKSFSKNTIANQYKSFILN